MLWSPWAVLWLVRCSHFVTLGEHQSTLLLSTADQGAGRWSGLRPGHTWYRLAESAPPCYVRGVRGGLQRDCENIESCRGGRSTGSKTAGRDGVAGVIGALVL
jgi:hypothetical protein